MKNGDLTILPSFKNTRFSFKTDIAVALKYGQGHWKSHGQVKLYD